MACSPNRRQFQCFLDFVNFYRRFIQDFSKIALPLTSLTSPKVPFQSNQAAQQAWNCWNCGSRICFLRHPSCANRTFLGSSSWRRMLPTSGWEQSSSVSAGEWQASSMCFIFSSSLPCRAQLLHRGPGVASYKACPGGMEALVGGDHAAVRGLD